MPENMVMTLKTARQLCGMKQKEAAEKLGISVDKLYNWENGRTFPDVLELKKIEEVYGIKYDNLIFLPPNYGKTVKSERV